MERENKTKICQKKPVVSRIGSRAVVLHCEVIQQRLAQREADVEECLQHHARMNSHRSTSSSPPSPHSRVSSWTRWVQQNSAVAVQVQVSGSLAQQK